MSRRRRLSGESVRRSPVVAGASQEAGAAPAACTPFDRSGGEQEPTDVRMALDPSRSSSVRAILLQKFGNEGRGRPLAGAGLRNRPAPRPDRTLRWGVQPPLLGFWRCRRGLNPAAKLPARRLPSACRDDIHPRLDVLPQAQRALWPALRDLPHTFVLYGGTALALRLGHRASVDFDFFPSEPLAVDALLGCRVSPAPRSRSEPVPPGWAHGQESETPGERHRTAGPTSAAAVISQCRAAIPQ